MNTNKKIESKNVNNDYLTRFPLDSYFQEVRLFVLAFNNTDGGIKKVTENSTRKYFLPRVNVTNYNVLIDGRNFYDQPINNSKTIQRNYKDCNRTRR